MNPIPAAILDKHLEAMVTSLRLTPAEMVDPVVREFLELSLLTSAQEKSSRPEDWTPEQRNAHDKGDWRLFSRLRGYTEEEIHTFARYLGAVEKVEAAHGDPDDPYIVPQSMSHQMQECLVAIADEIYPGTPWVAVEKLLYAAAAERFCAAFDRLTQFN